MPSWYMTQNILEATTSILEHYWKEKGNAIKILILQIGNISPSFNILTQKVHFNKDKCVSVIFQVLLFKIDLENWIILLNILLKHILFHLFL